jgi:hypothetical protein
MIADYYLSFVVTFDLGNRWVLFSYLMQWVALEKTYVPHSVPLLEPLQRLCGWRLVCYSAGSDLV